jgi:hypothetical protein
MKQTKTHRATTRETRCPNCTEVITADPIHVCPASCCYVGPRTQSADAVCPYCQESFALKYGHTCLVLVRLTEPAQ